jgi:signal transduction histidine kinase
MLQTLRLAVSSASPTRIAEERLAYMQQRVRAALEHAESAQFATEHQTLVINGTLSLLRLQSAEFEFLQNQSTLRTCWPVSLQFWMTRLRKKGLESILNSQTNLDSLKPTLFGSKTDIVWVKQVIINLLSNSLEFTETGRVDHTCCRLGER